MCSFVKKYDLIVAGGGLSGVAAAVSAAREGLSVLLIEKSGCLGGAISNNIVFPFMPYWTTENGEKKYLSKGIFLEMIKRIKAYDPETNDSNFKSEIFKLVLDDLVTESGVDVIFHSTVTGVKTEERKVKSIDIFAQSGIFAAEAEYFIDTTGDGNLFALAGCDYQLGREKDCLCQPMTTCFRMCGVDVEQYTKEHKSLTELYQKHQAEGKITNPREDILSMTGLGNGIVHFNTTRVVKHNPTDVFDVSRAEISARRQVHEMVKFLKENSTAFKNSTLVLMANEIGVRESRKLKGEHILTVEELKNLTVFEDSIALGNYDIDIHNPEGSGTSHYYFKSGEYYTIPYRSLLPKEYDNLLVAGRCISATHEAQASVRIMPICACLGQAAGTAVAIAKKTGADAHSVDVKKVQKKLIDNGAVL